MEKLKNQLTEKFLKLYPSSTPKHTFCPYRICPIGAHSDHQYGLITGLTISEGITIIYEADQTGLVEITSVNFPGTMNFHINEIPEKQNDWCDYLRGAAFSLSKKHRLHTGIRTLIYGSLPIGGLSSSAAVIIAFLSALCKLNNIKLDKKEIIMTALDAENNYVGVSCGKLDQSCEILGKKNHLLFLDTRDDSYELIPQNESMKQYEIAIFFSGIQRSLVGSAFNMRVDELKAASYALKGYSGMEYGSFKDSRLRDVPVEIYEKYKDRLPDNWKKRAEHYYSEYERVKKGVEAWRDGDIEKYGRLSFESGLSSINNFETGSLELKNLYNIMLETDGVYGGRFSGAGFKGCCMAIIDPKFKEKIKREVTKKYLKEFGNLKDYFSVHFCHSENGCDF